MLAHAARRPISAELPRPVRPQTICVVDPQVEEYQCWRKQTERTGLRLEVVTTAAEALRLARNCAVDRWVINTDLPDRSGGELCEMLRSRRPNVPIALVSNSYSET